MHELSLVAEIYRAARKTVDGYGPHRIEAVKVAVGELAAVEPDLLSFAWEAVTRDTPDAGARLDVDFRPAKQTCAACGDVPERVPGSWLRLCPRCGGPLGIEGGDDLDVVNVTFEDESAPDGAPS